MSSFPSTFLVGNAKTTKSATVIFFLEILLAYVLDVNPKNRAIDNLLKQGKLGGVSKIFFAKDYT